MFLAVFNVDREDTGCCDSESTANENTREERAASIEKLHASVDQLDAAIEKLTMETLLLIKVVPRSTFRSAS